MKKKPLEFDVRCYENFDKKDKSSVDSCASNYKLFIQKYFNFSLSDEPRIFINRGEDSLSVDICVRLIVYY